MRRKVVTSSSKNPLYETIRQLEQNSALPRFASWYQTQYLFQNRVQSPQHSQVFIVNVYEASGSVHRIEITTLTGLQGKVRSSFLSSFSLDITLSPQAVKYKGQQHGAASETG